MSGNSDERILNKDRSDEPGADESARLDLSGEFFSVGSPLHAVRAGYIRRRADDLLYEAAVAGRYSHIIAPDRSGKSSLIAATTARLENNGFSVAVLDLEQIGTRDGGQDAGRWYYSVAYRLLRQLRIRYDLLSWWQDKAVLSNRQRLLEFYSEVILPNVQHRIAVFVDGIQCIAELPFADQLLASIRSAHNARTTDPEFTRLTFVLIGECDPLSLVNEPELSPFNVTQAIPLDDFTRQDLNLFATELNLDGDAAQTALDRIYHWTRGQPYLSQKLARAVARERLEGDIEAHIDRIVKNQLAGRAALHSEPHMSHIHREIVSSKKRDGLLNLYGRIRTGIDVPADLGSALQRRLMAVGLLEVDESGELRIRNRIYAAVFTARWANENLPTRWRAPLVAAAVVVLMLLIPLWYTQWLPKAYVDVLTSADAELPFAETAWRNLRSFPGHADTADNLFRTFLRNQAGVAQDVAVIDSIAEMATELPAAGLMPQQLLAGFWDRQAQLALREERRDEALLASLRALVLSTPQRRNKSAMLVGTDYPELLASVRPAPDSNLAFDPSSKLLSVTEGATFSQWLLGPQGLSRSDDWTITALEVTPLVRRVIVDREGSARRIGLTLNMSHPRLADLRIRLIAPSGRAVEIDTGRERLSSNEQLRIPEGQLAPLVGESLPGTWSISVRDEATGVAGHLVGWSLTLNSQVLVEDFQRGIGIPDPTEQETEQFWISSDGRYAVARATQSDSARLWDVAFAKPVATIAINEHEQLIGIDSDARQLVTATLDTINLWDTASGKRIAILPVGPASRAASLTGDGRHLFVTLHSDVETRLQLWSLESRSMLGELVVAGAPALVALDASGQRIAVADYDRAVRVWEVESATMLAQLDLRLQPSEIGLNAGGEALAVVFGTEGLALMSVANPQIPLAEHYGDGDWQFRFSNSGARFVAGRPRSGYQLYETADGRQSGPMIGTGSDLLAFNQDEDLLVTAASDGQIRYWRLPVASLAAAIENEGHSVWNLSGDAIVAVLPDASTLVTADRSGHLHFLKSGAGGEAIAASREDVSFIGHNEPVRGLAVSADGSRIASFAEDNSIRFWNSADGSPSPFLSGLSGELIDQIVFSNDGTLLAVLAGSRVVLLAARTGDVIAEMDLREVHTAMAFGAGSELYLGSASGALSVMATDDAGTWNLRRLWDNNAPIQKLEASPGGRFLVIVDQDNRARQFSIAEGKPGDTELVLPGPIEDLAFSPGGSRVLFRTARWVHRASSSPSGLIWLDALLAPAPLNGARIVFGEGSDRDSIVGNAFYLPVSNDGELRLLRFRFTDSTGPGLFGNKDELITEWGARLGLDTGLAVIGANDLNQN